MTRLDMTSLITFSQNGPYRYNDLISLVGHNRFLAYKSTLEFKTTRACSSKEKTLKKIREYLISQNYMVFQFQYIWIGIKESENGYVVSLIDFVVHRDALEICCHGDEEEWNVINEWVESQFDAVGALLQIAYGQTANGGPKMQSSYLRRENSNLARQSFYPWLSVPLEDYFKAYMESDDIILICYGPPGMGKSTFLRSLILSDEYGAYLAFDKTTIESRELLRRFFDDEKVSLLIYEDADHHVRNRDKDPEGSHMISTWLNMSDGIKIHTKKKIIISTNLSTVASIDPALMRARRCFDILPFRELTTREAALAREDVGLPVRDFTSKDKWSLAEALSKDQEIQQTVNRFGRKIGFEK